MPLSALASTLSVTGSRPMSLQHQRPRRIDLARPLGPHDAGRLRELDDRRALDLEALAHPGRAVDRALAPVAVEVRAAPARLGVALGLLGGQLRPLDRHGSDDARADEFELLV